VTVTFPSYLPHCECGGPRRDLDAGRAERRADAGVAAANARLTASNAVVLLVLLAAEGVTILRVRELLTPHVFIGMVLIPPVLLTAHKASFVLWFGAVTIHVLGHLGEVFRLAPRDWLRRIRRDVTGAGPRQWPTAASLVVGCMLGFLHDVHGARFLGQPRRRVRPPRPGHARVALWRRGR
jgi:hypothetical protein